MNVSPTFITPLAWSTAINAETPVPVGDRSILPGLITQALRLERQPSTVSRGPVMNAKE